MAVREQAQSAVYVQRSVRIQRPVAACAEALLTESHSLFAHTEDNDRPAVGFRLGLLSVSRWVVVELGPPARTSTWASMPMRWRATSPNQLYPTMQGKIELSSRGERETRLTVSGRYRPPLGRLGQTLDAAFMHSVASATVSELAQSIARRLEQAIA
jgi:hypothetical protein